MAVKAVMSLVKDTTMYENNHDAVRAELSRSMNGSKGAHFDKLSANGNDTIFVAMTG